MVGTHINGDSSAISADAEYSHRSAALECDIILDTEPLSGLRNMALDAALLQSGASCERCIIRIYSWREPTISLGYFQQVKHATLPVGLPPETPRVRRMTGGGAILHDQEITYSCVIPRTHPIRHNPTALYVILHKAIIELLRECGVTSHLRSDLTSNGQQSEIALGEEAFLCFLRSDPNDIVCVADGGAGERSGKTVKVVGSAQRRRQGTILQHGSILISESPLAGNVPGIRQLFPDFCGSRFQTELPWRLAQAVSPNASYRQYSPKELDVAGTFHDDLKI